jgi:hypothetical protein
MSRRAAAVVVLVGLLAAAPAAVGNGATQQQGDGPDPRGITLSGAGFAPVEAPARPSEESVRRALEAARPVAISRALNHARRRAAGLAQAAGLTLGDVVAVRGDELAALYRAIGREDFCRRSRSGRPSCFLPRYAPALLTVTFATRETDAAPDPARSVTAAGEAVAPVEPDDADSSASIRRALMVASIEGLGPALAQARSEAATAGRPAGIAPGQVLSIVEQSGDFEVEADAGASIVFGPFGFGEFCGTVTRPVVRRDPDTGRRVRRRVRRRVCHARSRLPVALRATFAAAD